MHDTLPYMTQMLYIPVADVKTSERDFCQALVPSKAL
jgi:hypothetical protein